MTVQSSNNLEYIKFNSTSHKKIITDDFLEYGENRLIDYLEVKEPAILVLIKIEEFIYLHSSLTSKISKKLQKRFAKKLFSLLSSRCSFSKIYLLERGEFALAKPLLEVHSSHEIEKEIQAFQKRVNGAKIKIGLVDYTLSIIISLSYGKNSLENAKVGMQKLLKDKSSFMVANQLLEEERAFAIEKLKTFKMLQRAIDNYKIVSFFQPIVNNKTKKVEKYESLVRLIDEENNVLSPYFFLETAKEGKYYDKITSIVLNNSFRALFDTNEEISINLSSLDITKPKTREEFLSLLERYRTEVNRITVELVEDESVEDIESVKEFLDLIKAKGVKIAIDDFGRGFSNFSRILDYEPDFIKIDGTLVCNIAENRTSRNMVETIVFFCKKQGIQTIAEYVENEKIYDILCEIGVDFSQGYYFGKAETLRKRY